MTKFHDVSLQIHDKMIVYPGNPQPRIKKTSQIPKNSVNSSKLTLGSHTGTHVDTPRHVTVDGTGVLSLPMDSFYGKCRVLDLTHVELEIHEEDLAPFDIQNREIILLKTKNSVRGYDSFRKDFVHVKIDAARYLVERGVKTLGVDHLSVKMFGGDDDVHEETILNMTLFEGLDLSGVEEGTYTFIGLPLRIDCDGSPARVILVEE